MTTITVPSDLEFRAWINEQRTRFASSTKFCHAAGVNPGRMKAWLSGEKVPTLEMRIELMKRLK